MHMLKFLLNMSSGISLAEPLILPDKKAPGLPARLFKKNVDLNQLDSFLGYISEYSGMGNPDPDKRVRELVIDLTYNGQPAFKKDIFLKLVHTGADPHRNIKAQLSVENPENFFASLDTSISLTLAPGQTLPDYKEYVSKDLISFLIDNLLKPVQDFLAGTKASV